MQADKTVFDKDEALEIIEDSEEFLKELAEIFINDSPQQISIIKEAVSSRNSEALEKSAHKLKGAVASFGEKAAFQTALKLEIMGKERKLDDAGETYDILVKDVKCLVDALNEFIKDLSI